MAARFYYMSSGTPDVSPSFGSLWNKTDEANRLPLTRKTSDTMTDLTDFTRTVPITTTQNILCTQFVSAPLHSVNWSNQPTFALTTVVRCLENDLGINAGLAIMVNVVSNDGGTLLGTVFSSTGVDSEFAASAATRKVGSNATITSLIFPSGSRLVVELGARVSAPTLAGTYTMRFGNTGGGEFALTSGLTTDLNPWFDMWPDLIVPRGNYLRPSVFSPGIGR